MDYSPESDLSPVPPALITSARTCRVPLPPTRAHTAALPRSPARRKVIVPQMNDLVLQNEGLGDVRIRWHLLRSESLKPDRLPHRHLPKRHLLKNALDHAC